MFQPQDLEKQVQEAVQAAEAQAVVVAKPAERVLAQYRQDGHATKQSRRFRQRGRAVDAHHLLNMARLAEHLRGLPEDYAHFEMQHWQSGGAALALQLMGFLGRPGELVPGFCGTSACAVGHAPNAGMGVRRPFENWSGYCRRLFSEEFFISCFDSRWSGTDNTPRGAAARMLYCLDRPGEQLHPSYSWSRDYDQYVA